MLKNLPELIDAGVISEEVADKIREYYNNKGGPPRNKLFIVFAILGALLVGLGIILIIAHNWDDLSKTTKTVLAFLPLLLGQGLSAYALFKKRESIAWREGATAFLFCAVGASISLVSQIYNIPGDVGSYLLTWMLLCLPLIYLMNSSITSLMYLAGITYYACDGGYWSYPTTESYLYWLLLLLALPHYYLLIKNKPESNFTIFHNWFLPLSVITCLGTVAQSNEELMFVAYMSLFGLLYILGGMSLFNYQKNRNNGYRVIGLLGTIILLLTLSFDWFWKDLAKGDTMVFSPEGAVSLVVTFAAAGLLFYKWQKQSLAGIKPLDLAFAFFALVYIIGLSSAITATVLVNILVLVIGLLTIRTGANQNHLGILNLGLLTIAALATCRFFDENISFVIRGTMFVLVGVGFFLTNFWMLKKRKEDEK